LCSVGVFSLALPNKRIYEHTSYIFCSGKESISGKNDFGGARVIRPERFSAVILPICTGYFTLEDSQYCIMQR